MNMDYEKTVAYEKRVTEFYEALKDHTSFTAHDNLMLFPFLDHQGDQVGIHVFERKDGTFRVQSEHIFEGVEIAMCFANFEYNEDGFLYADTTESDLNETIFNMLKAIILISADMAMRSVKKVIIGEQINIENMTGNIHM